MVGGVGDDNVRFCLPEYFECAGGSKVLKVWVQFPQHSQNELTRVSIKIKELITSNTSDRVYSIWNG